MRGKCRGCGRAACSRTDVAVRLRVPKTPSASRDPRVLMSGRRSPDGRVRLIDRAAATALPRHVDRVRRHTAASDERCRQGHPDIDAAPPAGRPAPANRQAQVVPADRAFLAAFLHRLPRILPGHDPAVAPRPHAPPPRRYLPPQAGRQAADPPRHPSPRPAPGPRERRLGLPAHPRRTRRPRHQGRTLHRVGDPPGAGDRAGARTRSPDLGRLPAKPAHTILACDFFTATTLSGARLYVFAVIEHANRRARLIGSDCGQRPLPDALQARGA